VSQRDARRAVAAVGVVLPVHDEEKLLPGSLQGLEAAVDALPPSISCRVAVVLDNCGDASSAIAHTWGARFGALVVHRECGSVGLARRAGSRALLSLWPEEDPARIWLATTDADSRVPQDWLAVQLEAYASGADMWAGRRGERYGAAVDAALFGRTGSGARCEPWFQRRPVQAAWRLRWYAHWRRSRSPPPSRDCGLSDRL